MCVRARVLIVTLPPVVRSGSGEVCRKRAYLIPPADTAGVLHRDLSITVPGIFTPRAQVFHQPTHLDGKKKKKNRPTVPAGVPSMFYFIKSIVFFFYRPYTVGFSEYVFFFC